MSEIWKVDNDTYHADRSCDSSSTLKVARKSLELYEALYINQTVQRSGSTPEMLFGSAFHCALLEPDQFDLRYAYEPEDIDGEPINRRLKAHREYLEKFSEEIGDRDTLPASDRERIEGMLASVRSFGDASEMLATGQPELGVKFDIGGYPLKALMDWSCREQNIILDVKTTRHSGSIDLFRREIDNREYHCQAAMYCEAYRQVYGSLPEFYWLFVHTAAPYETYLFKMGNATRKVGLEVTKDTIDTLRIAKSLGRYRAPSYGVAADIELPIWTLKKYNLDNEVSDAFGS